MNAKSFMPILTLAVAIAACSGPPPRPGSEAAPDASGGPTSGTQSSGTTSPSTTLAAYDPANDPLVNPPVIFQPYPKDRPERVDESQTLVVHMAANPSSLNLLFWSSFYDDQATAPIYTGLFTMDNQMNWKLNPDACLSYEEAPDHLSAVAKIKPGLTWQDGEPWTAEDIRFSWQTILDPKVPAASFKSGTDQVTDVEVIDPWTARFVFKEALATNKWNVAFPIIPKHVYDNPAERAKDPTLQNSEYFNRYNREGVVGSGPYKLARWIPNDRLEYESWDGYTGEKPHYKRLIYKIQPDANVMLLLFKQGELDVIDTLTSQQFATQTHDAPFVEHGYKVKGTEWTYAYIGWNMDGSNPFFSDVRVRRAMAHAMNIGEIIENVMYNLQAPSYGIYHPEAWMFNPQVKRLEFDLARAAALLDEAGWRVNPDDGWRYKTIDGRPVKFEFELKIPQGSDTSLKLAPYYQRNLKRIGVSMTQRVIEWATFHEENMRHDFQAHIAAWGSGADPDMGYNIWRTEMREQGRNYGGYSNPRVDELYEAGRREFDPAKRAAIYREIHTLIYDDQPYLFLTNRNTLSAVSNKMRGFMRSPVGITGFDPGMSGWWTPAGMTLR